MDAASKIISNLSNFEDLEETEVEEVVEKEVMKSNEALEGLKETEVVEKEVMKANEANANQAKEITEFEIFDFAVKTYKTMKELGILSIVQGSEEIQLKTKEQTYKLSSHEINNKGFFEFNKLNTGGNTDLLSSSKRSSGLTGPAIKIAQLLHQLLTHLNKLPTPPPTMNPSKFDNPELYNQALLRKLERDVDLLDDDDFLNINEYLTLNQKMLNQKTIIGDCTGDCTSEDLISEVDLLKNIEDDFDLQKEEMIKKLSCQIGKIYDEIISAHVVEEVKRREKFRFYVEILLIQRRIAL